MNPFIVEMIPVNSIGMIHFVDGLLPRALSVSKYWRAIVFESTVFAAEKIKPNA